MNLTLQQKQVFKADIAASTDLIDYNGQSIAVNQIPFNDDGHVAIANAYNKAATPNFTVWKTSVSVDEIMSNGFVWTAVDGLTAGKARIWEWMSKLGSINPSKPNIRQGLADAFGNNTPMANGILPHLKELATRAERLFATGTGTDNNPGTRPVEAVGAISAQEIAQIRSL